MKRNGKSRKKWRGRNREIKKRGGWEENIYDLHDQIVLQWPKGPESFASFISFSLLNAPTSGTEIMLPWHSHWENVLVIEQPPKNWGFISVMRCLHRNSMRAGVPHHSASSDFAQPGYTAENTHPLLKLFHFTSQMLQTEGKMPGSLHNHSQRMGSFLRAATSWVSDDQSSSSRYKSAHIKEVKSHLQAGKQAHTSFVVHQTFL